jgi:hypothetical protein
MSTWAEWATNRLNEMAGPVRLKVKRIRGRLASVTWAKNGTGPALPCGPKSTGEQKAVEIVFLNFYSKKWDSNKKI